MTITKAKLIILHLLNNAGEVAARSFKPSDEGFIVNTTWRFFMTLKYYEYIMKQNWQVTIQICKALAFS